ncbi:polysaccharide export protein [Kushneria sinocarnis]|nr:polysaccharide export protein [Kushneria sinocarnis]
MKRLLSLVLLGSTLVLGGCALAPGSNMPYDSSSPPIDDLVDVRPITMGLVQSQNRARETMTSDSEISSRSVALSRNLADYQYHVGIGDTVNVIVYDHPELTNPSGSDNNSSGAGHVVNSDGTIFFPYIGRVRVAGETRAQIRDEISGRLGDYVAEPQVEVNISDFQSQKTYVTGEVSNPGVQPITNVPLTLLDAISRAGGMTDNADWHHVVLNRDGDKQVIDAYDLLRHGQLGANQLLRAGDVVHVPEVGDQKVYVMGEVRNPQGLAMGSYRMSLTDALSQAGGMDQITADASGIFVVRRTPDRNKLATVYQLDAENAAAMALGTEFQLEPQDIVYVTTAPISRWNRVISQLLPTTGLFSQGVDTRNDIRDN